MKQVITFFDNALRVYVNKSIALLILAGVININAAVAQEHNHGGEQRPNNRQEGERRTNHVQMPARQQGSEGSRQAGGTMNHQDNRNANTNFPPRPGTNMGNARQNSFHSPAADRNNANTIRPGVTRPVVRNVDRSNTTITNTRITNIQRNNVNYRRPAYSANNPSWRYANIPKRNSVRATIPSTYRTISYGGSSYRYNNGVFYRPYNNTFMVVAPPVGIYLDILPVGYRKIYVHNYPYYYYNGTYYDYRNNNYLVVSPPVGAIVESLPAGYETVTIDGQTYYTVDGAQYRPVVQDNGEIWYEVIKAN